MTSWNYTAVPLTPAAGSGRRRGAMTGQTAADVRASLRRVGWQVVEIRPARRETSGTDGGFLRDRWHAHLRRRRQLERCDLCDSLATMLESGVPVLEAVRTLLAAERGGEGRRVGVRPLRRMLVELRDALQGGDAFADAVARHPAWFDAAHVAMIEAGQQRGELAEVLRHLARRSARSEAVARKLSAALAYPAVVATVGVGVVLFLSVKTLPELTRILVDAELEVPLLTRGVMGAGQFVLAHWMLLAAGAVALAAAGVLVGSLAERREVEVPPWARRFVPRVLRRMGLAALSMRLAELVRTGIPVAEALRIAAPTMTSRGLRRAVDAAALRIERGHELSAALDDPDWFDAEYRRLIDIGQASGELDTVLERLGQRYERQAERLVDRLAALLEPAVILGLAALVGTVVMSAILPLLRLQEILR